MNNSDEFESLKAEHENFNKLINERIDATKHKPIFNRLYRGLRWISNTTYKIAVKIEHK